MYERYTKINTLKFITPFFVCVFVTARGKWNKKKTLFISLNFEFIRENYRGTLKVKLIPL